LDPHGRIILRVVLNGGRQADFLLDTGSTGSAVSQELAADLGLQPVARSEVLSPAGREMRPLVALEQVTVGTATVDRVLASVTDAGAFKRAGLDAEGILGQDFLARFDFTLDYRRRRLVWDVPAELGAERAPREAARVPLVMVEDRLIAEVTAGAGRPSMRLVPDTGANAMVLYETAGTAALSLNPVGDTYQASGLLGRRDVRMVRVAELAIGELTLRNQPAAVMPAPPSDEVVADGLLPLHLFEKVTFRSRERVLLLWK
jgi:predicted aspartyl protease